MLKQHASEVHDLDVWQQQTSVSQQFTSENPDPKGSERTLRDCYVSQDGAQGLQRRKDALVRISFCGIKSLILFCQS